MNPFLFALGIIALGASYINIGRALGAKEEKRKAIRACIDMANRYDSDIEGCDGEDLITYTEGISCSYRLAYIIKYGKFPTKDFPLDKEFQSIAKELLDEQLEPGDDIRDPQLQVPDEIQSCTRPLPHICCVNGPCNGFPKETPEDNDALRSDALREEGV